MESITLKNYSCLIKWEIRELDIEETLSTIGGCDIPITSKEANESLICGAMLLVIAAANFFATPMVVYKYIKAGDYVKALQQGGISAFVAAVSGACAFTCLDVYAAPAGSKLHIDHTPYIIKPTAKHA